MVMKRGTVLFILLLIQTFLLSGCWDRTEVNDLAIIMGAGVDLTEDHQLELSVNLFLPSPSGQQITKQSGSEGGSTGLGVSIVRTVRGATLAEAVSKLQQYVSRELFWGQDEVYIFGKSLAEAGIYEPMEFLLRHPDVSERANVFVSKKTAKEVLEVSPPVEDTVSEALREIARGRTGMDITLTELAQMMAGKSKAAVIPMIDVKEKQSTNETFPYILGTAIIKNGKMVGSMDENVTRGAMWIRNEVEKATITVSRKNERGAVSVLLFKSQTEVDAHIDGDRWSITVRIHSVDDIVENNTDQDFSIPDHIEELQTDLEGDINERVYKALDLAQKQLNADIFYFADAFYRKYPQEWKKHSDRWDDIFPNVEVNVQTKLSIRKPGLTRKSFFKLTK